VNDETWCVVITVKMCTTESVVRYGKQTDSQHSYGKLSAYKYCSYRHWDEIDSSEAIDCVMYKKIYICKITYFDVH
jgi:hypothetical protein